MFKRKSNRSEQPAQDELAAAAEQDEQEQDAEQAPEPRAQGPYDATEVDTDEGYIDLGAVLVRPTQNLEIRLEKNPNTNTIVALTLVQGGGAVQLRVLAAPRSGGLWDAKRDEIIEQVTKEGGRADAVEGPWGAEVSAAVKLRNEQGGIAGMQGLRFVGVEGPRWLLQATFMGDGANPDKSQAIEALFRSLVVVRGDEAMPVGVLLTFRPPQAEAADVPAMPTAPSLDSLEPGARITEVR